MRLSVYVCLAAAMVVAGCQDSTPVAPAPPARADYARPLPAGGMALRKLTPATEFPDFAAAAGEVASFRRAIASSLNYLSKPSSREHYPYGDITHAQVVKTLAMVDSMLESKLSPAQIDAVIRRHFDVYTSVGWNGNGAVLFTGYYTPVFEASATQTKRFRYPLYQTPEGLAKGPAGEILGLKLADGQMVRCPQRRYLAASGLLAGRELVWMADPFEAYIAHVQGSASLRMTDGRVVTVGYAGSNGHEYKSVAAELVRDGRIDGDRISLPEMIRFFRAHPSLVDDYVNRNPRFTFFARSTGPARGSLNEPVTPMRTLATDKSVYPRAALAFVQVDLPGPGGEPRRHEGFVLDQDTGGAIRAPGRCDIYIGVGSEAGQLAGRTLAEGRLYYLFVKPKAATSD